MKHGYTPESALAPEDIDCLAIDCCECPFFLRIDICGYEVATNLYSGKEALAWWQ